MIRLIKYALLFLIVTAAAVTILSKPRQPQESTETKPETKTSDPSKYEQRIILAARKQAREDLFKFLARSHTGNVPVGTTTASYHAGDLSSDDVITKPRWMVRGFIEGQNAFGAVDRFPFSVIYVCGIEGPDSVEAMSIEFNGKNVFKDERWAKAWSSE